MFDALSWMERNLIFFKSSILAMGAGKSKKEAKHAAAKNLIDKMTGAPFNESNTSNSSNGNLEWV